MYLAVHSSSQAVGSRRLKQLPRPPLVKSDDGSHVVLGDRAVDERGDEDSSQPLHAVQVCKRLIGKIPETQRGYIIVWVMEGMNFEQIWLNVPQLLPDTTTTLGAMFYLHLNTIHF